jgi:glucose/arabinose dehydrogenase
MIRTFFLPAFALPTLLVLSAASYAKTLPLADLKLPDGYKIEVYAEVPNARQMAQGADGIVYVGSRRLGKVHAVVDSDHDYKADEVIEIDADLNLPTGVAYKNGSLYVGAVNEILEYKDIDTKLKSPPTPTTIYADLPKDRHHGWKFIDFGPDGDLYVPIGAPCNICLSEDPRYASILRMDVSNPKPEIYVAGVRNTVGFDWHPTTGNLWFSDNGRDMLGDEFPPCELNEVTAAGQHFGYPFYHADGKPDPEFGDQGKAADQYREPALLLGPHVAPLGVLFYTGDMLPAGIKNQALIAEHGSWNRSPEAGHTGYRITIARELAGELMYEVLVEGWLDDNNEAWGRPVDLLQLKDGSLLVSDDRAGVLYRITYSGAVVAD